MTVEAAPPRNLLRRLYDWCIDAAHKPHAMWTMGAIAFAESSFFPIPPDVMLIPMALARPQRAYVMAAWCTLASVLGGLVGYAIGSLLYDSVGAWLIHLYGYGDKVETFRAAYAQWGAWIILLKGLTPIPYKIVTITSGFAGYNFALFILFSIIARAGRILGAFNRGLGGDAGLVAEAFDLLAGILERGADLLALFVEPAADAFEKALIVLGRLRFLRPSEARGQQKAGDQQSGHGSRRGTRRAARGQGISG